MSSQAVSAYRSRCVALFATAVAVAAIVLLPLEASAAEATLPAPFWTDLLQSTTVDYSALMYSPSSPPLPAVGMRVAVRPGQSTAGGYYPLNSIPVYVQTPPYYWGTNLDVLVQTRVTTANGTLGTSPKLFTNGFPNTLRATDAANGTGCERYLVAVNGSLQSIPIGNVTSALVEARSGAYLTCDWQRFTTFRLGSDEESGYLRLDIEIPSVNATQFDAMVWVSDAGALSVMNPAPMYNYLLWKVTLGLPGVNITDFLDNNTYTGYIDTVYTLDVRQIRAWEKDTSGAYQFLAASAVVVWYSGMDAETAPPVYNYTTSDLLQKSVVECTIADPLAYTVEYYASGTTNPSTTPDGEPFYCESAPLLDATTIGSLMAACEENPFCVGFVTTYYNEPTPPYEPTLEVPECMMTTRPVNSDVLFSSPSDRLFHWRNPSPRLNYTGLSCDTVAAVPTDLRVFVANFNMNSAVLVDGKFAAFCRPKSTIDCGDLVLCTTVSVDAGAKVSVVPWARDDAVLAPATPDLGCWATTFHVVFEGRPATGSSVLNTTENTVASNALWSAYSDALPIKRSVVVPSSVSTLYLSVSEVSSLTVAVRQNRFGVVGASSPVLTLTAINPNTSATLSPVTCGGSAGFVGATGLSNQCNVIGTCPANPIALSADAGWVGYVRVDINWTNVDSTPSWPCSPLIDSSGDSLELYFSATTSNMSVYSMGIGFTGYFITSTVIALRAIPVGDVAPPTARSAGQQISVANSFPLGIPSGVTYDLYIEDPFVALPGNVTMVCAVDAFDASTVTCVASLPSGSTTLVVLVEDGNLQYNAVTWSLMDGITAASLARGTCGGSEPYLDGAYPTNGECGAFHPCAMVDMTGYDSMYMYVAITVPSSVGSSIACPPFAFSAMVVATNGTLPATSAPATSAPPVNASLPPPSFNGSLPASSIAAPAPFWTSILANATTVDYYYTLGYSSAPEAAVGVRVAPRSAATTAASLPLYLFFESFVAGMYSIDAMVQIRVTSTDGTIADPLLFYNSTALSDSSFGPQGDYDNVDNLVGCNNLLTVVNGTLISLPIVDATAAANVQPLSGGLLTCDWQRFNAVPSLTNDQFSYLRLDVAIPFTNIGAFDAMIWIASSTSSFLVTPAPQYNYLILQNVSTDPSASVFDSLANASFWNLSRSEYPGERLLFLEEPSFTVFSAATFWPSGEPADLAPIIDPNTSYAHGTISAVECLVADVASYRTEFTPALDPSPTTSLYAGEPIYCDFQGLARIDNVGAVMSLCEQSPFCVGFETVLVGDGLPERYEALTCLYTTRPISTNAVFDAGFGMDRIMHWRSPSRSPTVPGAFCSTIASSPMEISVYVENGNVQAAVTVDGAFVEICLPDRTVACGELVLCTVLRVNASAVVDVVPWFTDSASPCTGSSLHAIFLGAPVPVVATLFDSEPFVNASRLMFLSSASSSTVQKTIFIPAFATETYVEVYGLSFVSFGLVQNVFGKSPATSPALTITATNSASNATVGPTYCGGSAGFDYGVSGLSNQCDTVATCSYASPFTSTFSGLLKISVNWTVLDTARVTWNCLPALDTTGRGLVLLLTGYPDYYFPDTLNAGFPGSLSTAVQMPTIAVPNGSAIVPSSSWFAINQSLTAQNRVPLGLPRTTFRLYSPGTTDVSTLLANAYLSCTVSNFAQSTVDCYFPFLSNAASITLLVEDANLQSSVISWSIVNGVTSAVLSRGACGRTSAYLDGALPSHGSCGVYRPCVINRQLATLLNATSSPNLYLRVQVPFSVASSRPCPPYAFSALAVYNTTLPTYAACQGYTCPSDGTCISFSQLCDGTVDCVSDGGIDELNCLNWYLVESAARLSLPIVANVTGRTGSGFVVQSVADCRRLATANSSYAFSWNATTRSCLVYRSVWSATVPYTLTPLRVSSSGTNVYAVLSTRLQYTTCTNALSCSGNGQATKLTSGICACICSSQYTGPSCTTLQSPSVSFSQVFLTFPISSTSGGAVALSSSTVASALQAWVPAGRFTCDAPLRLDANSVSIVCNDAAGALSAAIINNATAAAAFNARYTALDKSGLAATSIAPTSIPKFESLDVCSLANASSVLSCELPGQVEMSTLQVSATPNGGVSSGTLTVNVTFLSGGSRRSGGGGGTPRYVTITCPASALVAVNTSGNRVTQTCLLDLTSIAAGDPLASFRVFVANSDGSLASLTVSGSGSTSVSWRRLLDVPRLYTPPEPATVVTDFSPYKWASIALLAFGGVLLCCIANLAYIHRQHLRAVLAETKRDSALSTLSKVLTALFLRMTKVDIEDEISDSDDETEEIRDADGVLVRPANINILKPTRWCCRINRRQWSFLCASFWASLWVIGVFLVLYFVTSYGITSDTYLVVERFNDHRCQNSTFASTPQASLFIADSSAQLCKRRHIAGNVTNNLYFAGYCLKNQSGGDEVLAYFKFGASYFLCAESDFSIVVSDSCLPSALIWGDSSDTTYTRIVCGSVDSANSRFGYLDALAQQLNPTIPTSITATPDVRLTVDTLTKPQTAAKLYSSVASLAGRFETTGLGTDRVPTSGRQLLIQEPSELFLDTTTVSPFPAPVTASLEARFQPIVPSLVDTPNGITDPTLAALLPFYASPTEAPVGQIYGYFNTTNELTGKSAGATSARYYGMRKTVVDIGRFVQKANMEEGQGFTISMHLRVTSKTYGFAWAVTDVVEDQATSTSPLLDRYITILQTNAGSSTWFPSDFSIYSSLFVDGPAGQLSFVYASPSQLFGKRTSSANTTAGQTLSVLTWDLEKIGVERLLNGLWHDVRIVLRLQNSQIKVQLIVDGETSRNTVGWNQCLTDDLRGIADYPVGETTYTTTSTQVVSNEGQLWTGYFNGGIAYLTFSPVVDDILKVWKASSPTIQEYNALNVTGYIVLGCILLGLAGLLAVIMIFRSGKELWQSAVRFDRAQTRAIFARFVDLISSAPPDPTGAPYRAIKFSTAKRWLGLNDRQISQFFDELQQSTAEVSKEVIRVLYLSGVHLRDKTKLKNITMPMPTAEEWGALIDEDNRQYIENDTRHFPCFREGKPEPEVFPDLDIDLIVERTMRRNQRMGSPSGAETPIEQRQREQEERDREEAEVAAQQHNADNGAAMIAMQQLIAAAVRTKAASNLIEQKQQTGEVNAGGMGSFGGGGGSQLQMGGEVSGGLGNFDFKQLVLPILGVLQTVYLWISTSNFVSQYLTYFGQFFSFISIDWVNSFTLPTIVTPLIQLVIGLLAFLFLLYLIAMDEIRFSWYVARYVLKRDKKEMAGVALDGSLNAGSKSYADRIIDRFTDPFGKYSPFPVEYQVEILPVKAAMHIDRYVGLSDVGATYEEERQLKEHPDDFSVTDCHGREFHLHRGEESKKKTKQELISNLEVTCRDPHTTTKPLELVGVFCRHHHERRLSPITQSDIYPFVYAPQCCVMVNGVRCNNSQGVIYSCQHVEPTTDGSICYCDYAVCERHYRGGVTDSIRADVLATIRTGQQRGTGWIIATVVMLVSNAAYMPFVKTAIMICACDPFYQCEFTQCQDFTDQKYLIAFYFSVCLIVLFGVGLPVLQVLQLRRRRALLFHIFFAEEYHDRYTEKDDEQEDAKSVLEKLEMSVSRQGEESLESTLTRRRLATPASGKRSRGTPTFAQQDSATFQNRLQTPITDRRQRPGAPTFAPQQTPNDQTPGGAQSTEVKDARALLPPLAPSIPDTPGDQSASAAGLVYNTIPLQTTVVNSDPANNTAMATPLPDLRDGDAPLLDARGNVLALEMSPIDQAPRQAFDLDDDDMDAKLDETVVAVNESKALLHSEWNRFLLSDPTVLGTLYKSLEFNWIYLSPIILLWKVVLICPAVFLPSDSFEQAVGIAATEVGFAVFMYTTAPFISPMADLMYRVGNVHQLLFLGLRNLDYVARYNGEAGYSTGLVLLTAAYLLFCVLCIAYTVLGPQISKAWDRARSTSALEELGFQFTLTTSLYVTPAEDAVRFGIRDVDPGVYVDYDKVVRGSTGLEAPVVAAGSPIRKPESPDVVAVAEQEETPRPVSVLEAGRADRLGREAGLPNLATDDFETPTQRPAVIE